MTALGHQAWLALLVIALTGYSFVFACAAPFAAFAVLAALTLSQSDAIRVTIALWLANQVVGYAVFGYPRTVNSALWGVVIALAAVLTTIVARQIVSRLQTSRGLTQAALTFAGAFAVFELAIYAVAVAGLGGTATFAAPIVARILGHNLIALAGLFALYRIGAAVGVARRPEVSEVAQGALP